MKSMKQYRQDLHQIPEISFKEYKTSMYLKKKLISFGYEPFSYLETDVIVFIDVQASETIAFRSDMDGLPLKEQTNATFSSTHKDHMHACGHDGHMSMLLGLAEYLKDKQDKLTKNILLIFQPAEEHIGGAKKLCEKGILSDHNVKEIYGIHLYPDLNEGILGTKPNTFMAMVSEVTIEVNGLSSHGALPEKGIDANLISAKLLIDLQTIQTRSVSALESTILTFGIIRGGTVKNAISDKAILEGTLRTVNKTTCNTMKSTIIDYCKGYERIYGCTINTTFSEGYLPVINDVSLYEKWKLALNSHTLHEFNHPLMVAEDFSFYQDEVPGLFFYVGTKNIKKGLTYSLHHPKFNFDEIVLKQGLDAYITILKADDTLRT